MIRVVVVADSGAGLRRLSDVLAGLPDVQLVRHCSGSAPIAPNLITAADLVLLDELRWPRMTVRRIAEIRAAGRAFVVVSASDLEAGWLADALRAGASALIPQSADAATLRIVMEEVVLAGARETSDDPAVKAA